MRGDGDRRFDDPGVAPRDPRRGSRIGIAEAAMRVAATIASRFGVVTTVRAAPGIGRW
jgi:Asp/Glu/hydantoin racemase